MRFDLLRSSALTSTLSGTSLGLFVSGGIDVLLASALRDTGWSKGWISAGSDWTVTGTINDSDSAALGDSGLAKLELNSLSGVGDCCGSMFSAGSVSNWYIIKFVWL